MVSFVLSEPGEPALCGELVVSAERAAAIARRAGVDPQAELALYVVHGLLHLCGYDDQAPADADAMRRREGEILAREGLTNTFPLVGHAEAGSRDAGECAVVGLILKGALVLGPLVLGVHLVSFALARALRTYSPSLLEDVADERGHAPLADDVEHHGEATEQAAGTLAVVTALVLAVVLTMAGQVQCRGSEPGPGNRRRGDRRRPGLDRRRGHRPGLRRIGDRPALAPVPADPRPGLRPRGLPAIDRARRRVLGRSGVGLPRPASVEVEIPSDGEHAEDHEAELTDSVREMIQRVADLSRSEVGNLKTPRPSIISLPASVSAAEAARAFRETGRSRIPIFGENRDDIVGILYAKDLFPRMTDPDVPGATIPRNLVRPAYCIPESKNAFELLEEFRLQRKQIAIVVDEYGSVAGLITLKDLLEELVGAIEDEHDTPSNVDTLIPLGGSRYEVDATLELEELNERLHLRLPTDGDFLTVGGLAFHDLGRVPEPGAAFRFSGVEFTVVEVVDHAIRRVRIDLRPRATVASK